MSLKDVMPGVYRAKAVGGKWTTVGPKETSAVEIYFEFTAGVLKETISSVLYITQTPCPDGATLASKTFDKLALLGYNEDVPAVDGAFGPLNLANKEVDIVLNHETKKDGKKYLQVQYINEIGGSRLGAVAVEKVLGNMNLKAEMAAARARMGATKPATAAPVAARPF